MTLRNAYAAMFAALALLALAVLAGGQRQAFADQVTPVPVNPCEDVFPHIPNMPGCGEDGGDDDDNGEIENPPVNPCDDIFPHIPNMPECNDDGDNGGGGEEPTDVCPNIEGDQASVPEGKVLENGQCVDAPSTGGGGGSGGGSGGGGGGGGGGGSVLGTTTAAACEKYISTFMRRGQVNDAEQVKRVQGILKMFEGADVEETGEYDEKSEAAIKAFQLKYADEVLTPWGIQAPTGYVFLTTRKKLNEVYCKNTLAFPLTEEEQGHIDLVKKASVKVPTAAKPAAAAATQPKPTEVEKATSTPASSEETSTPVKGNRIKDFFRRLFDRLR
ncbi:peptidoglycan-binding protein [bacterium]|nr:peptidoglycan-binding protein [bacterium]